MTGPLRLIPGSGLSDVAEHAYAAAVEPPARLIFTAAVRHHG
ncbi:hypothetical protein [Micromonospora avicenniae]|nr:hypothetical protein [Micromonospora avicenniae]